MDRVLELLEKGISSPVGNDFPSFAQPIATPSKRELVRQWFLDHPEDLKRTGRDLANSVKPMGVEISYRYWNDGKVNLEE